MNKRKQNSAYDRTTEKRNKMAGPKGGPAGLSHYGRNHEPNTAGSKEKQRWAKEI